MKSINTEKRKQNFSKRMPVKSQSGRLILADRLLIVCFLILLLVPLLCFSWEDGGISEQENRTLAKAPSLLSVLQNPDEEIPQLEEYLNDHIGMREEMLHLNQKLNSMLDFNDVQRNPQYILIKGKEGHFYYATDVLIWKYQGKYHPQKERMEEFTKGLNHIDSWLKRQGIMPVLLVFPDKESVYPEYYTDTIFRGEGQPYLEEFLKEVKTRTSLKVLSAKEAMEKEKDKHLLYNKRFDITHHNEYGAFCSYQYLMKELGLPAYEETDYQIQMVEKDGDFVPEFSPLFSEKASLLSSEKLQDGGLSQKLSTCFATGNEQLPVLLAFRDSYFGYGKETMLKFLPESFSQTITFHYRDLCELKNSVAAFSPDYVILSCAEREIDFFMNCVIHWEKENK